MTLVLLLLGLFFLILGLGMILYFLKEPKSKAETKTIKFSFKQGEVFLNLIQDEEGKRLLTYHTSLSKDTKDKWEEGLAKSYPRVYNDVQLWLSYDKKTFPELSAYYGAYYV